MFFGRDSGYRADVSCLENRAAYLLLKRGMGFFRRIMPLLLILTVVVGVASATAAPVSKRVQNVRAFLEQGNFSLAISASQALLKTHVSNDERFQLLSVLAQAEEMSASFNGYENVNDAVHAYQSLRKEFPKRANAADILWRIAWLYWKGQDLDRADLTTQVLLQQHPHSREAKKASLLRARILIKKGAYAQARGVLLSYYGLGSNISAREEAEGLAWMAVIDRADGRGKQAFKTMQNSYASIPSVIEQDPSLYAVYIQLLAKYGPQDEALHHADQFVKRYISDPAAPAVRLLQADLLEQQGDDKGASDIYGVLADRYRDFSVGKKALMRQLVMQYQGVKDKRKLRAMLHTLASVSATNQMSDIETEAQLYEARILVHLAKLDDKQRGKMDDRAIGLYALAASSTHKRFAAPAVKEGSALLQQRLQENLDHQRWLQAVVLWRRYPQLRSGYGPRLSFAIAHAYMQLLDFTHAEPILEDLYSKAKDTVWGQRVMLERAKLWLQRGDSDGVNKVMHWLAGHEYTLYRQDLLLMVVRMQVKQKAFPAALQTLSGVHVDDLTPALMGDYWHASALVNMGLKRWHVAANAWGHLAEMSKGDSHWHYMRSQAQVLLNGEETAAAERVLLQIPEKLRDPSWMFAMASALHELGRFNEATEYLQKLAGADPANNYTTRARMMLAEQRADQLERQQQER